MEYGGMRALASPSYCRPLRFMNRVLSFCGIAAIAFSFRIQSAQGEEKANPGRVCDRNGIVLMEVGKGTEGTRIFNYPLKALGAQLLSGLDPAILPQPGETVYLTIDARAQAAAEKALRAVSRGCAVVMDSDNGDILAMASVPSFDPNARDLSVLKNDPTDPLRNRAISAVPPGATFLPVTALAGLAAGLRGFQQDCTGSVLIGNRMMKCWIADKDGGHGRQGLAEGMKNSCNTFWYQYGVATGIVKIDSIASLLGLGLLTGIPLKDEAPGVIPGTEWLKKINPRAEWTDGLTANTAIGQGDVLVTPLQMTVVAAAIGNEGSIWQPRLVDRIVRRDGKMTETKKTIRARLADAGIPRQDVEIVRESMRQSVNESDGNARKAATPGFAVAGRTGTSQIWRSGQRDNVTAFIGSADSAKGHYAFSVFVEGAKSGGGVAAPLAARILAGLESKEKPAAMDPAVGSFNFVDAVE